MLISHVICHVTILSRDHFVPFCTPKSICQVLKYPLALDIWEKANKIGKFNNNWKHFDNSNNPALKYIISSIKRKNVKFSGLFLRKSCNANSGGSQGLIATPDMIRNTQTPCYFLTIIFPIKTFQKQLKVFEDSSKTTYLQIRWKMCLVKREKKNRKHERLSTLTKISKLHGKTRLQYPKFWHVEVSG